MRAGRWIRLAFCALFFLCLVLARSAAVSLENQSLSGLCTLTLDGERTGQDGADMRAAEQEKERPAAFVLWGQQTGVFVGNQDLNRSAICSLITLWGDSSLLYTANVPLAEEDREGCLIDEATAMTLFGSAAPIGSMVTISGDQRTVRGILDASRPLVVVRAGLQEDGMNRVTLRVPEGSPLRQAAEDFALQNGLFGQWSQPGAWAGLAKVVSPLPVVVVLFGVIVNLLKTGYSAQSGRIQFWINILLAGGAWFLLLWLVQFRFQFPEEMIPNRWSDFNFWGRLFTEKKEELLQSLAAEKTVVEVMIFLKVMQAGFFGILALLMIPLLPRPATPAGLWLSCAAGALLAFGAVVFLDSGLAHDRAVWLTLPAGFTGRWLSQASVQRSLAPAIFRKKSGRPEGRTL